MPRGTSILGTSWKWLDGADRRVLSALATFVGGFSREGAAEVAGAVIGPDTLARAVAMNLDLPAALASNDAHTAFAALGDQVVTGPTLTNVNDFRALLLTPLR